MWHDENLIERLRKLAREVGSGQDRGFGRIPVNPTGSEMRFLNAARDRLVAATGDEENWTREAAWLEAMSNPQVFSDRLPDEDFNRWRRRAGVTNAKIQNFRGYAYLYEQAAFLHTWEDPVVGILHQTVQRTSCDALWVNAGASEPVVNTSLVNRLHASAKEVVEAVDESDVEIPEGCAFSFLAADMQGERDFLDSDIAFVVGTYIDDRPMYRVCLLQAKWRPRDGGKIGQNGGRQLANLTKTGMGFYLFYPRPGVTKGLGVASVRRAEDVNHDVWSKRRKPNYLDVDPLLGGPNDTVAFDFPYFVAVEMTSGVANLGRLFPDEISVAEALRAGREIGLVAEVFVADSTGRLCIQRFAPLFADMFEVVYESISMRKAAEPRSENGLGY